MNDKYEVIKQFVCHGKQMVTVRIGNAAHVMSQEEWEKLCGSICKIRKTVKIA